MGDGSIIRVTSGHATGLGLLSVKFIKKGLSCIDKSFCYFSVNEFRITTNQGEGLSI